jgi:hypothetical protein
MRRPLAPRKLAALALLLLSASITATNVANRRVLLDNSLTFGGFHFNDPRQLYAELRYRFHF